jgi:hypothetical protein
VTTSEPDAGEEEPAVEPKADAKSRNPDPHKPTQIAIVGKKGYGKTELAWLLFDSYPKDRLGIDPNGDIGFPPDTVDLESPVPARWPGERFDNATGRGEKRKPQTLRYVPNPAEPDYLEQMDRAVGLAYGHPGTCLLVDEAHEAAPANRTPPHMRRALRQGRHRDLTMILATPRPLTVDPLVIAQADWVYVFMLPNPADRKRVAEIIGWDPKEFDAAVHALEKFEYLRYDSAGDDLAHYPPLPADVIRHHKAQGSAAG